MPQMFEFHIGEEIFFLNPQHILRVPKDCKRVQVSNGDWFIIRRQNEQERLRKLLKI